MADDVEYVELARAARDALFNLLDETDPGLGMIERRAYRSLTLYIAHQSEQRGSPTVETEPEFWSTLPTTQKETHIVEFLDERPLTIRDLTEALRANLHPDYSVYESMVRSIVNRLFRAGRLAREAEPWQRGQVRYRYYVPRKLEGPIAELERVFREGVG